jgi:tetratricopeptide (TPR) repeat protein
VDTRTARIDPDADDLPGLAQVAFDTVHVDPREAERLARRVIASPAAPADARVLAHLALGRALTETGDMGEACVVFGKGVEEAVGLGRRDDEARLRMSWAVCLQAAGDAAEALVQLDVAEPHLRGAERGRLIMQRGLIRLHLGDGAAAIADYDRARRLLRVGGDRLALARLLSNRGVACAQLGRFAQAQRDFHTAEVLARELGQDLMAAGALHNLGYLHGRVGRVPDALRSFELARDAYAEIGSPGRLVAALDADQCEVLLASGLATEALELAVRIVATATLAGNAMLQAEGRLLQARAMLLLGRWRDAAAEARAASEMLRSSGRRPWAALAEYVAVHAEVAATEHQERPPARLLDRTRRSAAELEALGWVVEAAHVRTFVGRIALALGRSDVAAVELAASAAARDRGTAGARAEAWHARALLDVARGNVPAARRAIGAGLRVVDRHRAGLGATELRFRASAHGVELARLGLRLALAEGTPTELLRWAERWRAGATTLTPPRAGDAEVEARLIELRHLHGTARDAALAGHDGTDVLDAIATIEREITRRTRLVDGDPRSVSAAIDVPALRRRLGDALLVEYLTVDDDLFAVVVGPGRTRRFDLGPIDRVGTEHDHLLFALRRLAAQAAGSEPTGPRTSGSTASGASAPGRAADALRASAAALDDLLVEPLGLDTATPLVVVPTGALHGIAWSALPSLTTRDTTIAPSAAWWLRADDRAHGRRVLVVEGPDLPHAAHDGDAVQRLHPGAKRLRGRAATSRRVVAALEDCDLAHLAVHGRFRADNPMFSSLRVADGPLNVYDLHQLRQAPRTVVLAACTAGRSGVLAGDELVGTATALLSLGVGTVVAPLLPVPDEAAARYSVALHEALAAGSPPALARALAAAQVGDDPGALCVAGSFQCIGTAAARRPI